MPGKQGLFKDKIVVFGKVPKGNSIFADLF